MSSDTGVAPDAQPSVESTLKPAAKPELSRMIPFVSQYIDEVKLSERKILVDWLFDY
jgi:ribosomal 30S subunit maturation factor RimM